MPRLLGFLMFSILPALGHLLGAQVAWEHAPIPGAPGGHGMAFDTARGKLVVFGGTAFDGDVLEWDGLRWSRVASSNGPVARSGTALVFDSRRARSVLFGGGSINGTLGDTWEWDGATWRGTTAAGPSVRDRHAMCYDASRGRVVLFSGNASRAPADTWTWDGSA